MFKKILVPVDLAHAEKGGTLIEQAKELSDQHGGDLILLNVIPDVPPYVAIELPKGMTEKVVSTALTGLRELVQKHNLATSTQVKVVQGHPAQEILKMAADTHADLILIASHQPGLSDYFLGSTASRVVRHAQCSVLIDR